MVKIAVRTEADVEYNKQFSVRTKEPATNVTTAISHATCMTAIDLNAKAIIAVTRSGNTARMVSKYRPGCQIIACTPDERTWRQMNLIWGVTPLLTKEEYSMEILLLHATEAAEEKGYVKEGDLFFYSHKNPDISVVKTLLFLINCNYNRLLIFLSIWLNPV